jgi:hypothetical protein
MRAGADKTMSNMQLEAYMLCLFGYLMFCGSTRGRGVEVPNLPRAEDRRRDCGGDAPDQLGHCSFGPDVQGLCVVCTKTGTQSILLGCLLLLHLWSYEWLPVSRSSVD